MQMNRKGLREDAHVRIFMEMLKMDSDLNFVDIGVNLGIYSIVAASLGRHVRK